MPIGNQYLFLMILIEIIRVKS